MLLNERRVGGVWFHPHEHGHGLGAHAFVLHIGRVGVNGVGFHPHERHFRPRGGESKDLGIQVKVEILEQPPIWVSVVLCLFGAQGLSHLVFCVAPCRAQVARNRVSPNQLRNGRIFLYLVGGRQQMHRQPRDIIGHHIICTSHSMDGDVHGTNVRKATDDLGWLGTQQSNTKTMGLSMKISVGSAEASTHNLK